MYQLMNEKLAIRYGVTAAFVATLIWDGITMSESENMHYRNGRYWFRSSYHMFTAIYPFLSKNMVKTAVRKLMRERVLVRGVFNYNPFDHTPWYTFTEYGKILMRLAESEDED